MVAVQRVVLPVRRMLARYDKKSAQFVPCEWEDTRGTLFMTVDQGGRSVMEVHGDRGEIGWKLSPGQANDNNSELFAGWVKAHPEITKEERR